MISDGEWWILSSLEMLSQCFKADPNNIFALLYQPLSEWHTLNFCVCLVLCRCITGFLSDSWTSSDKSDYRCVWLLFQKPWDWDDLILCLTFAFRDTLSNFSQICFSCKILIRPILQLWSLDFSLWCISWAQSGSRVVACGWFLSNFMERLCSTPLWSWLRFL